MFLQWREHRKKEKKAINFLCVAVLCSISRLIVGDSLALVNYGIKFQIYIQHASHRNLTEREIQKICKTFLKIAYISFLLFWDYTFPALHVPSGLCGVIHRSLPTYLPPKVEINPFFKRKICYTTLHFQYPFSYISAYNDKGSPPNTP